ncbi:MAG: transcriptional regulator [Leifsonia sp.]|nr:transcriptional regulator [Leifsonia sp.]
MPNPAPPSPWRAALGSRVRELRIERDWTQEALAEHADIHTTYVSGIERGRRNVSLDILHRVATALGVEIRELF